MAKKSETGMQEKPSEANNVINITEDEHELILSSFRVPKSLHRRSKAHAALTGRSNQEILVELIRAYLEEVEKAG